MAVRHRGHYQHKPDSGTVNVYRDAAQTTGSTSYWQNWNINYANGAAPVTIGTGWLGSGNFLYGTIGEVRISNIARSKAWIAASYHAERDSLMTYGTLQSNGAMLPNPTPTPAPAPAPVSSATFGLNSGNAVYKSANFNQQRFQNTAGSGALTKLEVLVNDTAASGSLRLGVYADNAGSPGKLLLDAGTVTAANGWVSISGLNLPVTAGTYYWLAYLPQNPIGISYQSTSMPAGCHNNYPLAWGTLPAIATIGQVNSTPFVMRATVTASSTSPSVLTFGLNGGNAVYKSANFNQQRLQNTAGTGTLTRLEVLVNDTAVSGSLRLGLYADNAGSPGKLLLDAGTVTAANGWVGISGLNLPVTAGTYYWLAYLPQNPIGIAYQSTGMPAGSHNNYPLAWGTLPAAASIGQINATPFVMRAVVDTP